MHSFFQEISDDQFNYEADFLVKESITMNLIISSFSLVLSIAFFSLSPWMAGIMLLVPIGAFVRGFKNQVVMKVNSNGFYYYGQLITTWKNFISVNFLDETFENTRGAIREADRFFLMIKYYKDGRPGYFGRKIRFTDTQDKSEEEIIAAIKFYYKHSQAVSQV
jgi:hypothetical protein